MCVGQVCDVHIILSKFNNELKIILTLIAKHALRGGQNINIIINYNLVQPHIVNITS